MLAIALSVLLGALLIALTLRKGLRHMSETVDTAISNLTAAISEILTDVATELQKLGDAAGVPSTLATEIQAQADRLTAFDATLHGDAPVAPAAPVAEPVAEDTVAGGAGDDTVSG